MSEEITRVEQAIERVLTKEPDVRNIRQHAIDIGHRLLGCEFNRDECLYILSMLYSRWRN